MPSCVLSRAPIRREWTLLSDCRRETLASLRRPRASGRKRGGQCGRSRSQTGPRATHSARKDASTSAALSRSSRAWVAVSAFQDSVSSSRRWTVSSLLHMKRDEWGVRNERRSNVAADALLLEDLLDVLHALRLAPELLLGLLGAELCLLEPGEEDGAGSREGPGGAFAVSASMRPRLESSEGDVHSLDAVEHAKRQGKSRQAYQPAGQGERGLGKARQTSRPA